MIHLQFIDESTFSSDTLEISALSDLIMHATEASISPEIIKQKALKLIIGTEFPAKGFEYKLRTEYIEATSLRWTKKEKDNYSFTLRFKYVSPIYRCTNILKDKSYELIDPKSGESFIYSKKSSNQG